MKYVYSFGDGTADGKADMKNLLGGKGANLAEMNLLNIPVPPGFTLTTEVCTEYYNNNSSFPDGLDSEVKECISEVEGIMKTKFGDESDPLLLSVRSGARQSMPGMMETVLNIGLTSKTIPGLIKKTGNPRFVYDAYRRLITMYADVVMEKAAGIEPKEGAGIRQKLEHHLGSYKSKNGLEGDTDLSEEDWKNVIDIFKDEIKSSLGAEFPDNAEAQLWGGIEAVFKSWNGARAISYRRIENIPEEWGTAVNVQTMVFGNTGEESATGVAFTRNPATGENKFFGEWLTNAQGEDVVAGLRTPNPLNEDTKTEDTGHLPSLQDTMPEIYDELFEIKNRLEKHYSDMQDIEFTIQEGKLWMLQTRVGKRNGVAAIKMAVDMFNENMIDKKTAIMRINPNQLDEMALPPCHILMQFNVLEDKYLSCSLYQRSGDVGLGMPFNIASYSFLTHLIARHCKLEAREFIYYLGNVHIYDDHIESLRTQIIKEPFEPPTLEIVQKRDKIEDYILSDFKINNYNYHDTINMKMRV